MPGIITSTSPVGGIPAFGVSRNSPKARPTGMIASLMMGGDPLAKAAASNKAVTAAAEQAAAAEAAERAAAPARAAAAAKAAAAAAVASAVAAKTKNAAMAAQAAAAQATAPPPPAQTPAPTHDGAPSGGGGGGGANSVRRAQKRAWHTCAPDILESIPADIRSGAALTVPAAPWSAATSPPPQVRLLPENKGFSVGVAQA